MKKICIIGSGAGIGESLYNHYRDLGYRVDGVEKDNLDLRDSSAVHWFSKELETAEYDIVIFTAGVGYHRGFYDLNNQEIIEQLSVNTIAPLQILRGLSSGTKFVYLSSVMQCIPAKNMPVYASSKQAMTQTLTAIAQDTTSPRILSVTLGAVKTQMHIKAGLEKMVGRDIEKVIPKLVHAIEYKQGNKTLFWDWWLMIYIVFPLYRLFLNIK